MGFSSRGISRGMDLASFFSFAHHFVAALVFWGGEYHMDIIELVHAPAQVIELDLPRGFHKNEPLVNLQTWLVVDLAL